DARRGPITRLAEQLDGESLFGRRLDALDPATFETYAARFRIVAVVALEDDAPRLGFLDDTTRYRRRAVSPFLVYIATEPRALVRRNADGSRDVEVRGDADGWASTGLAYYPLWR